MVALFSVKGTTINIILFLLYMGSLRCHRLDLSISTDGWKSGYVISLATAV